MYWDFIYSSIYAGFWFIQALVYTVFTVYETDNILTYM